MSEMKSERIRMEGQAAMTRRHPNLLQSLIAGTLLGTLILSPQVAFSEELAPLVDTSTPASPEASSSSPASSIPSGSDPLAVYEQKLLTESHANEPLSDRIGRLETFIFGEAQSGSIEDRQTRLLQVLRNTAPEATPKPVNPDSPDAQASEPPRRVAPPPVEKPDATDYPTVTTMEENVFGQNYRQDSIANRLARLENKIFGNTFPNMQLIDRVDNLVSRAPSIPQTKAGRQIFDKYPDSNPQYVPPTKSSDVYLKLDAIEKAMLNGKSNTGKLLTERVDILEKMAFGTTSSADNLDNRVNRLIANFENGYGGGYQNRPPVQSRQPIQQRESSNYGNSGGGYGPSYGGTGTKPSQNIRIGSTFGSNSQYQYSQDLLDMLPNDVRPQIQGAGPAPGQIQPGRGPAISSQSSSQSYTASGPGTVIIQESTEYSGFPGFGGMGGRTVTQSRNLFTNPGGYSQSYSSTLPSIGMPPNIGSPYPTVNPYGQVVGGNPYGNPYNNANPYQNGYQNNYNPGFGLDPILQQQLNNMEVGMFGQANPYAPLPARLNQLEASIFGQNFVGYSEQDRINNLQRAYQTQSIGKNLGNGRLGKVGRAAGSLLYGIPMPNP